MEQSPNGHYRTSDLEEASALRASGLRYYGTEWRPIDAAAKFIFDTPPEDLRIAWDTHTMTVNVRALFSAWNALRNDLEDARRRRVR